MPQSFRKEILVSGATSPIGDFLLPRLRDEGFRVHALSRHKQDNTGSWLIWHRLGAEAESAPVSLAACHTLIHLAPLWVLPDIVSFADGCPVDRIIAFGSTSRFTKTGSESEKERDLARRLADAEDWMIEYCESRGIDWTLFRPTLVYGTNRDKSITTIRRFIRKFGFFPLAGPGDGLRQPVHADDLAGACISCLNRRESFDKAYNLSGGEVLSFRRMLERIAASEGRELRVLRFPATLFRLGIMAAKRFPQLEHIDAGMLARAEQDLNFGFEDATRDFGYQPRSFNP